MKLSITTPEKVFFTGEAESIIFSALDGERGVLDSHTLMVAALGTGPFRFKNTGEWRVAVVSGGFAHIKGTEVVVLADTAEWPDEIELKRAEDDKRRAEEVIRTQTDRDSLIRAMIVLQKANVRINMVNKTLR